MSKIIDCISYNGEADILELRLSILGDLVDEFIIVEAPSTFSGGDKPLYFHEQKDMFSKWFDKITYHVIDETYTDEEIEKARASQYTGGIERWVKEYLQKESISRTLTHLEDEDTVYLGDVDEIWEHRESNGIEKLKLRVYPYYLNLHSDEQFWGTIRCKYKDIKGQCLNDIRNNLIYRTEDYQGWHFTNQGGYKAVEQKIKDQYNTELFNDHLIKDLLPQNFGKNDFIGRDFALIEDESEWPQFLIEHRNKYNHLIK